MSGKTQEVLTSGLTLSESERAALADGPLLSIEHPAPRIDRVWALEADSRIAAFEAGKLKALSEERLFAESE